MNPYESPKATDQLDVSDAQASARRALQMVSAQRGMMWLFVLKLGLDFTVSIAAELFDPYARVAYFVVFLAVTVGIAYFVSQLAGTIYGVGPAIVCLLLSMIPCMGIFAILILNGKAMDELRKLGIKVGFMGASAMQLEQLRNYTLHEKSAEGRPFGS